MKPKQFFAFVLMPFDGKFDDLYQLGIKQAVEDAGMIAERVDEQIFHGEGILERVYNQINAASFIIADMTDKNPNVFYEVGYAHALKKRVILLTSKAEDIPFDLKHHRHIVYDGSLVKLRTRLKSELGWMAGELSKLKPSFDVKLHKSEGTLTKTKWSADGHVTLSFDVTNAAETTSPEIDVVYFYTGGGWTFTHEKSSCPKQKSDMKNFVERHQVVPLVKRLPKTTGWTRITLAGEKPLAMAWKGEALDDTYKVTGSAMIRIVAGSAEYDFPLSLDVEFTEFPF